MFKILLAFIVVFFVMFFGIREYRKLTGKDKWDYAKLVLYSTLCAILSIGLLVLIVVLF